MTLREQFEKETGKATIIYYAHCYADTADYVKWLEARLSTQTATPEPLQQLMNEISAWSDATFGNGQRNPAIIHHLKKEVDELIYVFNNSAVDSPLNHSMRMEFADCMMLLVDSAHHAGFTADDLLNAMREKLEINKQRKWGKPDENGVVEHIKDAEHSPEVMANVTDSKPEPMNIAASTFLKDYPALRKMLDLQGCEIKEQMWEAMETFRSQSIATPEPLKSKEEIFDECYIDKGYDVGITREQALEAMQLFANQQRGVVTDEEIKNESDRWYYSEIKRSIVGLRVAFRMGASWMRSKLLTP